MSACIAHYSIFVFYHFLITRENSPPIQFQFAELPQQPNTKLLEIPISSRPY